MHHEGGIVDGLKTTWLPTYQDSYMHLPYKLTTWFFIFNLPIGLINFNKISDHLMKHDGPIHIGVHPQLSHMRLLMGDMLVHVGWFWLGNKA
jgi:hypothetical protein